MEQVDLNKIKETVSKFNSKEKVRLHMMMIYKRVEENGTVNIDEKNKEDGRGLSGELKVCVILKVIKFYYIFFGEQG